MEVQSQKCSCCRKYKSVPCPPESGMNYTCSIKTKGEDIQVEMGPQPEGSHGLTSLAALRPPPVDGEPSNPLLLPLHFCVPPRQGCTLESPGSFKHYSYLGLLQRF